MLLDERTLRLIAIGASISANCQHCLQTNVANALKCGATEQEIAEAIWVGTRVRRGATYQMDKATASMNQTIPLSVSFPDPDCECA